MNSPANRIDLIRARIESTLQPNSVEVIDDSDQHAGHSSAGSKGHFTVNIVAEAFRGKTPIQRHRMVYDALNDLMQTDIHALSIHASIPA